MKGKLVIIGASAMGREACIYARECGYEVKGFLDSRDNILSDYHGYPPVLGPAEKYTPEGEDIFICAIGDPTMKRRYVEMFPRVQWATLIHPKAYVGDNVILGEGSIICPNATITCDTEIGKHVIINVNASISHDCRVKNYVSISPGCTIAGWCTVGEEVFVGAQAALIAHIELGRSVFVAAGAIVTKSTDAPRIMGVPAKPK